MTGRTISGRISAPVSCLVGAVCSVFLLFAAPAVEGQVRRGFPNVPQTKGAKLSPLFGEKGGRTSTIAYQDGYIAVVYEAPASAGGSDFRSRFFDISNPAAPKENFFGASVNAWVNGHGYVFERGVLLINGGWRFTNGVAQRVDLWPDVGVIGIRGGVFAPFFIPTHWPEYGGSNNASKISRSGRDLCIFTSAVPHHPVLIGTTLYFLSDSGSQGIAAYDVAGCFRGGGQVRELGVLRGWGGYWGEIWGGNGRLMAVNVHTGGPGTMYVADITDPTNMRIVKTFDVRQLGFFGPVYPKFQDGFLFAYNQKVDMTTFANERVIDSHAHRINVSHFKLPLGNLLVTGGINHGGSQGLAIWAHQAEPDNRPPFVGFQAPKPNESNYPVGAPITLLIHDTLESSTTVPGVGVILRPITASGSPGDALPIRVVFSFDQIMTITPNDPLQPNTTYEVVLPQDGIRDAAGNGMRGYSFRFSTGPTVVMGTSTLPPPQPPSAPPPGQLPGARLVAALTGCLQSSTCPQGLLSRLAERLADSRVRARVIQCSSDASCAVRLVTAIRDRVASRARRGFPLKHLTVPLERGGLRAKISLSRPAMLRLLRSRGHSSD